MGTLRNEFYISPGRKRVCRHSFQVAGISTERSKGQ